MSDVLLFDIQRGSLVDGPGIRTAVFFQGCDLRCGWCHNPESQQRTPVLMVEEELCIHCGVCKEVCPHPDGCTACGVCADSCPTRARRLCGTRRAVSAVMEQILADRAFYENTGGGVTFTGGECMLQPDGLAALLRLCRQSGIHTAVDTAGHVPWETFRRILPDTDLFLYDVKCLDDARHRIHTGAGNRLILENLSRLLKDGRDVIVRIPAVAGVNDDPEELRALLRMLEDWGRPRGIELLPCHGMGARKYRALGRPIPDYCAPGPERMDELRAILKEAGY